MLNEASLTYTGSTPSVDSISSFSIAGMAATGDNTNTFGDIAIDTAQGILYASTSRGRFYSINLTDPENSFTEIAASAGSDRAEARQEVLQDARAYAAGSGGGAGGRERICS